MQLSKNNTRNRYIHTVKAVRILALKNVSEGQLHCTSTEYLKSQDAYFRE